MKKKEPAFEDGLARLEELVGRLEDRRLGLDQALSDFEEGLNLSAALKKKLDEAAGRVEKLTRDLAGRPLAEPLDLPTDPEAGDEKF
jgi:exodeoxyribonuclease VII small subunit